MEIFFGIITRQAVRHGTFRSVKNSPAPSAPTTTAANPFTWTKDADGLIAKITWSKN
jgi:hypothetical protein